MTTLYGQTLTGQRDTGLYTVEVSRTDFAQVADPIGRAHPTSQLIKFQPTPSQMACLRGNEESGQKIQIAGTRTAPDWTGPTT